MQITRVKISKLYGFHHYDIYLEKREAIKIIHAPNGFGKTTILKLIKATISAEFDFIKRVPFETFLMECGEELTIQILKSNKMIVYTITGRGENSHRYPLMDSKDENNELIAILEDIHHKFPIYFIDANRLWTQKMISNQDNEAVNNSLPTVLEYAKELKTWMTEALAQAHFYGQTLDRSFPKRLITQMSSQNALCLSQQALKTELIALEERRAILESIGLFEVSMRPMYQDLENLDETIRSVLTLYIQDSKEKLKMSEKLALKINMLCQLINKRFAYKKMEISREEGFLFTVPTHEKLKADQLSSGEQNELILMFTLLFKAPKGALILMDEPEISLHIAWQQSFLEDMEAIVSLTPLHMIIATHSPDIINGRWNLTTGLEE